MAKTNGNKEIQEVTKQEVETSEGVERTRAGKAYIPRVDIYEKDDALVLLADMPGVDENSLDITLEKNVLSLRGQVNQSRPENYSLAYSEYGVGDYERSFNLSNDFDWDKIEASIKNGVVRVDLPKAGPAQTRKITVNAQ